MGKRVPRTRNSNTWTEAEFWGKIRSALRRISMYYKPMKEAKLKARRVVKNKRHKYEYKCAACNEWFKDKEVEVDHILEAGSLRSGKDLEGFVERLFAEDPNAYQILCKNKKNKDGEVIRQGCHQRKTNKK